MYSRVTRIKKEGLSHISFIYGSDAKNFASATLDSFERARVSPDPNKDRATARELFLSIRPLLQPGRLEIRGIFPDAWPILILNGNRKVNPYEEQDPYWSDLMGIASRVHQEIKAGPVIGVNEDPRLPGFNNWRLRGHLYSALRTAVISIQYELAGKQIRKTMERYITPENLLVIDKNYFLENPRQPKKHLLIEEIQVR